MSHAVYRLSRLRAWLGTIRAAIPMFALALGGCGYYSLSGGLPSHVRTVGVDFFENTTVETGLEERLGRALGDQILGRPQFRYASARVSDALVRGRITAVHEEPLAHTGDQVTEYQVLLTVDAEVWDRARRRALWQGNTIRGLGTYDPAAGLSARDQAYTQAVDEVAKLIIDGLLSGW